MSVARALLAGALIAALVAAAWAVARPLRERPRPPTEVSIARYRRLAPVVTAVLVTLGGFLVVSLVWAVFH